MTRHGGHAGDPFDDPITLRRGRQLVTLKDAANSKMMAAPDVVGVVSGAARPFGLPNQQSPLRPDQVLAHRLSSAIFFDTGQ